MLVLIFDTFHWQLCLTYFHVPVSLQAISQPRNTWCCSEWSWKHPCFSAKLPAAERCSGQGQKVAAGSRNSPGEMTFKLCCIRLSTFNFWPHGEVLIINFVWLDLQLGGRIPLLDSLSELVLRAEGIPVRLDPLTRFEALVTDVQAWKESAAKTFLVKNSPFSLLEVNQLLGVTFVKLYNLIKNVLFVIWDKYCGVFFSGALPQMWFGDRISEVKN